MATTLRHALQGIISQYRANLPRVFQNIFLMAADEDSDALELEFKMARLPELAEAVHVYYSASDEALSISDRTKGNPDRLGSTGPRTLTNLPHKITLVDCRNVDDTSPLTDVRHQYYRKRPEVIADVRQVSRASRPTRSSTATTSRKRSYRIGRSEAERPMQ
jgi:esterase/lipase superfamily enzyme